jgi:DNA polymerase-1
LAASDPNLLAMPNHGKFAGRFREGFVSGDGHVLGSWDLSQIELRVLAHLSQDPVLLNAFRTGQDLHAKLAQRIFGGVEADHKKGTTRLAAKAINFGIPMGMTNIGLCIELKKNGVDVTEDDAQRWLTETMALYGRVPEYQQEQIGLAKAQGFVTTLLGRRRYVGGIRSSDGATRSEAERFAFATPIQGSAQDVMKTAEKHIWEDIILKRQDQGQWIEPLLQIHDDIILECDERIIKDVNPEMVWAMTQTFKGLSVPIETSGDYGYSWGDMHEIEMEKAA